ncbi:MAG: helix-hairpin-helix domain-containing protein [Oscillospiraceae bacterium]|nr:helix-hairpin-helix domain-containing protein [Oscillospiraceae bacterium]
MRLRRMELAVLGITLAFILFMGGFFTGRSWSAVNIAAVAVAEQPPPVAVQTNQNPAGTASTNQSPMSTDNTNPQETQGSSKPESSENTQVSEPISDGRININTASKTQLKELPGIGDTLAERIIEYRTRNGSFSKIDDIRKVTGIGERRFEAIQDMITVGN